MAVVAAGTADRPVAAEARAVTAAIGLNTRVIHDVGVAGLDRVLQARAQLDAAHVVIVIAGMEGALASVIGGLVACPVVAVPTSVGYGASLEGITAGDMLLGALLDAGAPVGAVREAVTATGLTGWELTSEAVTSNGLTATRIHVRVHDPGTERRAADLLALASRARPNPVAELAVRAVTAIIETEARLHATNPLDIHLHELGGHDTIIDIVGTAAALHALGVTAVYSSPLPLARSAPRTARFPCQHGPPLACSRARRSPGPI